MYSGISVALTGRLEVLQNLNLYEPPTRCYKWRIQVSSCEVYVKQTPPYRQLIMHIKIFYNLNKILKTTSGPIHLEQEICNINFLF